MTCEVRAGRGKLTDFRCWLIYCSLFIIIVVNINFDFLYKKTDQIVEASVQRLTAGRQSDQLQSGAQCPAARVKGAGSVYIHSVVVVVIVVIISSSDS